MYCAACLKTAVNFLVGLIYKMKFWGVFSCVFAYANIGYYVDGHYMETYWVLFWCVG